MAAFRVARRLNGMSRVHAVFGSVFATARLVVARTGLFWGAFACTETLDPSIVVGGAGSSGEPLGTCSSFTAGSRQYVICPASLDFESARADCVLRGATLAAAESAEENDFIATSAGGVVSGNLWLGGTRDDAYVWSWPDGSVFWRGGRDGAAEGDAFVRWQPGEPNDSSTVTTDPERCLALTLDENDWNDRACSIGLPYVCERPSEAP